MAVSTSPRSACDMTPSTPHVFPPHSGKRTALSANTGIRLMCRRRQQTHASLLYGPPALPQRKDFRMLEPSDAARQFCACRLNLLSVHPMVRADQRIVLTCNVDRLYFTKGCLSIGDGGRAWVSLEV
jgi:hypothetical protein